MQTSKDYRDKLNNSLEKYRK